MSIPLEAILALLLLAAPKKFSLLHFIIKGPLAQNSFILGGGRIGHINKQIDKTCNFSYFWSLKLSLCSRCGAKSAWLPAMCGPKSALLRTWKGAMQTLLRT